jgi:peroxiredoxin
LGGIADELAAVGIPRIVGVSHDSPPALKRWAKELELGYPLLSDLNWEAARAFGVLRDELFRARPWNTRGAFIVDREGVLRWAWVAPEPSKLPDRRAVLAAARELSL